MNNSYETYKETLRKIADLKSLLGLANWDSETYIPNMAIERRGKQIEVLSGIIHELSTAPSFGILLGKLIKDPSLSETERKNVELTLRDFRKAEKLPKEFVERLAIVTSEAFSHWQKAKKENNFALFASSLTRIIDLKREQASFYGADLSDGNSIYEALFDEYEPGMKIAELDSIFLKNVKERIIPLVKKTMEITKSWDTSILNREIQGEELLSLSKTFSKAVGFDFERGRLDISTHPFTMPSSSMDVRLTTRPGRFSDALLSTIHESGHGIYEQGMSPDHFGLPQSEACSHGIHESQSLIYERCVSKNIAFMEFATPMIQKELDLPGLNPARWFHAVNKVEPTFIRTESDELSYHVHILIRYEIEKDILSKKIQVEDIPKEWNAKYKEYLGIDVPNDSLGCLQDVHWSHGGFGYFPTYSLGSFYAIQFFEAIKKEYPDIEKDFKKGDFKVFKSWLNENIHKHGRLYSSSELCKRATGETLNLDYFIEYYERKFGI